MDMVGIKANLATLEQQLKDWGSQLQGLTVKANKDAKADYKKSVADVQAKYQLASAKLKEYKAAGEDDWDSFKDSISLVWSDVESAMKKAMK
jgi:high-affinity Fe2+/Pb2+ permease